MFFSGQGSFSTVYLAESRAQRRGWVAIKVVEKRNLLKNTKKITSHRRRRNTFEENDEDTFNMEEENDSFSDSPTDEDVSSASVIGTLNLFSFGGIHFLRRRPRAEGGLAKFLLY